MLRVILFVTMLFNNFMIVSESVTEVKKIEYEASKVSIELKIDLYSNKRDVVELIVFFCDESKGRISNDYYSSSLIIENYKTTRALIPFNEEVSYLNIIIRSNNKDEVIEDIMFPLYKSGNIECDLNKSIYCESEYPTSVIYENKVIREKKDKIVLVNEDLDLTSFNNLLPLNKIRIKGDNLVEDGEINLYLEERIDNLKLYYKDRYVIPLIINKSNDLLSLELASNYYVDMIEGITYEDYKENSEYSNKIVFPYINKTYNLTIELDKMFVSISKVIIRFNFTTSNKLIGDCSDSKYCVKRSYL